MIGSEVEMKQGCSNISDAVARRVETQILDGSLPPGKKIPSERQLSQTLGVSRPLVREALRELRGRGVIKTEHGRGSFVVKMIAGVEQDSPLIHMFKDHSRTLYDLLEVRELLEGQAAYLATQRGNEKDLYCIRIAYEAMTQYDGSESEGEEGSASIAGARLDHAFHCAIADASHNPVLIHTLQSLSQLTLHSVFASVNNLYHRPQHKQQIDEHHLRIYTSIMERQGEAAQAAAVQHVREIHDRLQNIEQQERNLIRAKI